VGTKERVKSKRGFEHLSPGATSRASGALELVEELIDEWEELAADAIGEEAVVADVAEIAIRDVSDELSQKIANRERDGCGGVGVVVEIFESDGLAVIGFKAGFTEGRAFEIFTEVFDGGLAVGRLLVEMDDPGFLIQDIEPRVKSRVGFEMF